MAALCLRWKTDGRRYLKTYTANSSDYFSWKPQWCEVWGDTFLASSKIWTAVILFEWLTCASDGKKAEEGTFKKPHSHKDKAREKAREKAKEKAREKAKEKVISPISEDFDAIQPADASLDQDKDKEKAEDADAPGEEILAAFKVSERMLVVLGWK